MIFKKEVTYGNYRKVDLFLKIIIFPQRTTNGILFVFLDCKTGSGKRVQRKCFCKHLDGTTLTPFMSDELHIALHVYTLHTSSQYWMKAIFTRTYRLAHNEFRAKFGCMILVASIVAYIWGKSADWNKGERHTALVRFAHTEENLHVLSTHF